MMSFCSGRQTGMYCIGLFKKENKHSINVQIDEKIKEISEDYDHFEQLIVSDVDPKRFLIDRNIRN